MTPVLSQIAERRDRVRAIRTLAAQRFAAGTGGIHLAAGLSAATDELIRGFWDEILASRSDAEQAELRQQTAIVAVGGTGRGELCPYSDIDLLFLQRRPDRVFAECASEMVRACWDAGLSLGQSVRTVEDAVGMARREPQFATSLVEARPLWGEAKLCELLVRQFRGRVIRGRLGRFIDDCLAARRGEFGKQGGAVQQLEPDLKKSGGGLRDLHLIRWVGFARFGSANLDSIRLAGGLGREEVQALVAAQDFITRVRFDLHLAAGKLQDLLTRDEQLRIAEAWRFDPEAGLRPVERFMQAYFRHSTAVASIAQRFVTVHRPQSLQAWAVRQMLTHRANSVFRVSPEQIDIPPAYREAVCRDPARLMNLYELCSLYGVLPSLAVSDAIKVAPGGDGWFHTTEVSQAFLSILSRGQQLGPILRNMVETGVLDRVIPEFTHARCLLQFNQYHHYTVDEHSLRAVEAAAQMEQDPGPLGRAYREITRKDILHLALLLHDLGKGFPEDHSEVGRRLAIEVAERLQLSPHLREVLVFLVHKHLLMGHLAWRRNVHDPAVVLSFSRDVGSVEILKMLYVLTAADVTAVGPDAWTNWKAELLTELYERTRRELSGESNSIRDAEQVRRVRRAVHDCLGTAAGTPQTGITAEWVNAELETLPFSYLATTPAEQIAGALRCLRQMGTDDVFVQGEYDAYTRTIDYHILTRDRSGAGYFSKLAGVLTAKRLEILSAQIHTSRAGIVLDSFHVMDFDFDGPVPGSRLADIETAIRDVLAGRTTIEQLFRTNRRFGAEQAGPVAELPMRVVIDNESSDRFTIIDVFAHDQTGLLYTIADEIRALGLSVELARIATHLDQVVDVFYVTNAVGTKLPNDERLGQIQAALQRRITEFQRHGLTPRPPTSVLSNSLI